MKCEKIQAEILDFSMEMLSGPRFDAISKHLAECTECAAMLEEEVAFSKRLAALPSEQPTKDVWPMVQARIKSRRLSPAIWFHDLVTARTRKLAAAAVAAAVMAVTVYVALPPQHPPDVPGIRSARTTTVMVKWSDDPLAGHTDAMVDSIDQL